MGRYYGGDIEGKFWFAVQGSYDPAFFHVKGVEAIEREEVWECCGSWCDECDEKCPNCTGEDGDEEPSSEKRPSESEVQFNFEFTEEQMELLDKRLVLLAAACGFSEEELDDLREAVNDKEKLEELDARICQWKLAEELPEEQKKALKELAELRDTVFHEESDGDSWATMLEAQMARVYLMDRVLPKPAAGTPKRPAAKPTAAELAEGISKLSREKVENDLLISTFNEAQASLYLGLRIEGVMLRDNEKCFMWCEC